MRPANAPPILAAWTPPTVIPTISGARWNRPASTIGASGSSSASAATSSRSGTWIATPRGERPVARRARGPSASSSRRAGLHTATAMAGTGDPEDVAVPRRRGRPDARVAQEGDDEPGAGRAGGDAERVRRVVGREGALAARPAGGLAEQGLARDPEEADAAAHEPRPDRHRGRGRRQEEEDLAQARHGQRGREQIAAAADQPTDPAGDQRPSRHRHGAGCEHLAGERRGPVQRLDVHGHAERENAEHHPVQRRHRVEPAQPDPPHAATCPNASETRAAARRAIGTSSDSSRSGLTRNRGPPSAIAATTAPR